MHGNQACALLEDASIKCWGENKFGQLGDGSNNSRLTAVAVVDMVHACRVHACTVMFRSSHQSVAYSYRQKVCCLDTREGKAATSRGLCIARAIHALDCLGVAQSIDSIVIITARLRLLF